MFEIKQVDDSIIISGEITYKNMPGFIKRMSKVSKAKIIDIKNVKKIDTSSIVFLLDFAQNKNAEIKSSCDNEKLLNIVKKHYKKSRIKKTYHDSFFYAVGYDAYLRLLEIYLFFGFLGEIAIHFAGLFSHPKRLRIKAISNDIERMGANAVPIVAILTFLIGVVIAYQGSIKLKEFGANIFIVDLVSISITRELGPLIVAILLAGRSTSSYTAQIGIMKVTEEIDVIKTMGLNPFDVLVFPKIISMLISLPLLVVLADVMGIIGGALVAYFSLKVSFYDFFLRLHDVLTFRIILSGFIKTPVFAFMIATIGCFKGFRTKKNVESIGENVTISVVDSIFAVIVIDAVFSVLFRWAGI